VLNSNRSLDEILEYIISEARRLLGAQAAAIYRLLPEQVLSIQSAQGLGAEYVARSSIPLGKLATGQAVFTRRPVTLFIEDELIPMALTQVSPEQAGLLEELGSQFQAILAVPLVIKDEPVGALTLYYTSPHAFQKDEVDLAVAFCDQSALAIENTRLREKAKEEAITAERSRLARDLHDSVTQMLFSANLIAEVLPSIWSRDPAEGQQALQELHQLTRGALAEMRSMLLELRPDQLNNTRLEDLVRQLTEAIAGRMHIPVKASISGPIELPPDTRLALYRITQEALTNIGRHSGATQIEVVMKPLYLAEGTPQGIEITIQDNGCGFDPQQVPADHLGLAIMRERAASIGAVIEILSQPQQGTEVKVVWKKPKEKDHRHEQ
jgi:two-component system nitrate/nitrite sensor histidine kinase NarX